MARGWQRVSLLLFLLLIAPGKPRLAPPQNVTLFSRNFGVYLTWLPGPGTPKNVTYIVKYHSHPEPGKWRKVEKCTRITELTCNLMCLKNLDLYNKFKARVLAISANSRSHWVESESLDYYAEVDPAPPVLLVTQTEEFLSISATYQLPHCTTPPSTLSYELALWKEGTKNKTFYPATLHDSLVQIPLQTLAKGSYCLSARTIYTFFNSKYSTFSTPTCFLLEAPGAKWAFLLLLLLPVLLLITTGCVIWKLFTSLSKQAKMPQVLDFSDYRLIIATLPPNGPESLDNLSLCPQKELSIQVRPKAQGRSPAGMQAPAEKGSTKGDKEEEEEVTDEDDDNDVGFQSYIVPPPLPEHSGSEGWGTLLVPAEKPPGWDSSSSSSWARTESSGYLSKEGSGQGLGREECTEPLLLPEYYDDSDSLKEPLKGDLASWVNWNSLLPEWTLDPDEPQVCLHTVVFHSDSSTGLDEEEEEEEVESGVDSENEDCRASSWGLAAVQGIEVKTQPLGQYMAR